MNNERPYALCKITPIFFKTNPIESKIALRSVSSHFDLVQVIVKHNFKRAAARILGAYHSLGNVEMARLLEDDLRQAGMRIKKEDPFEEGQSKSNVPRGRSPYMARIFTLWESYREDIIAHFPPSGSPPDNAEIYLKSMDAIFAQDAYNSLSIEGYVVNEELIEQVKNQRWKPDKNEHDRKERDALAARGYFEAFQEVKKSISEIIKGAPAGKTLERDLQKWYRALFSPSTRAGILSEEMLYGYRKGQVYIRGSRHVPSPKDAILDAMEALFTCLKEEPHAGVRAILGHFIFVFIHPYIDGNGRIARFLMNAMLASGGYPWTIIQVVHRQKYFKALEMASVENQIVPFTKFVAGEMLKNSI